MRLVVLLVYIFQGLELTLTHSLLDTYKPVIDASSGVSPLFPLARFMNHQLAFFDTGVVGVAGRFP